MRFEDALRELNGRQPESMPGPTLDRMRELVKLLDHPELTYPTVHVTGTNGKTTTARMVAAVACGQGLTAGAYISPHIGEVTERFSVCGVEMFEEEFGEEFEHLQPFLEQVDLLGTRVTYFEALSALAFLWFADKPVGLGVVEVGMGGTWDATNLIRSEVAVLCPIGVDHKELGSTAAETAVEKAGIIKEGKTAVVREQRPEVLRVVEERAEAMGATLLVEGRDFELAERWRAIGGQSLAVRGLHGTYDELFLPLFGDALARNAAVAVAAVEALLGRGLDEAAVRTAMAEVISPGRIEVLRAHPTVVLDGAHNLDAAEALAAAVGEAFRWDRLHLVLGMFGDKDIEGVAGILAPTVDRAYATPNASPRSAPAERTAAALRDAGVADVLTFGSVEEALREALDAAEEDDLILVTGSFYTVADARPLLAGP